MNWLRQAHLWGAVLPVALALQACGGDSEVLRRQLDQLRVELGQVRSAQANSTVMLEDLQNKMLLLEDQVDSTRILVTRNGSVGRDLPVVRLAPQQEEYAEEEPTPRSTGGGGNTPQVVFQQIDETGSVRTLSGPPPAGDRPKTPQPVAEAPKPKRTFDARPVELYKTAYDLIQKKQHAAAIEAFQRFLEEYPNHDYADNALYWMGEAYYDSQDFQKALECFDKLITLYPDGNKVPDAMLKSGLSCKNVGQMSEARTWFDRLVQTYPQTPAARIAREKMADLR